MFSPSKFHFSVLFVKSTPFFLENIIILVFFCLSLSQCLLVFWNKFSNIPFLTQVVFIFGWLFFCCCFFHGVYFCLSVSMLVLFLVIFLLCFLYCFLFCFRSMKNIVFPAILVFLKLSWLKSNLFFMFNVFVIVFSCVVCLQSKQWSCIVFCLCCLFFCKQDWMVFWFASCGLVSFLVVLFFVFHSFQKKTKNRTQQKPPNQKCRKKD